MQFNNTFPTESVMTGMLRKQNQKDIARKSTAMYLRPTPEGTYYRLRLLNFPQPQEFIEKANLAYPRDYPFIFRHSHVYWQRTPDEKAPNGVRISTKTIVCPQTDYVRANSNLTGKACPICTAGNQAWAAYRDSNKKNMVAKEKGKLCATTFEALVPVYIVGDPTYSANDGNVRVLILNKEQAERIVKLIQTTTFTGNLPVWNDNAVDLYLSYGKVDKTIPGKNGAPDYHFQANDIIKMGFTQTPHAIKNLDSLVEELQFDENWFTIPTVAELDEFYEKYIATSGSLANDIPDDIPVDTPVTPAVKPVATRPAVIPSKPKAPVEAIPAMDAIPEEPAPAPAAAPTPVAPEAKPAATNVEQDIDSFLAGLNIG